MIIRLTTQQERDLLRWAGNINAAHYQDGAMSPGYFLVISISPFGEIAEARCDPSRLDLGNVEVVFEE